MVDSLSIAMKPAPVERYVTILKVNQPNHYVVKEVPDEHGSASSQMFAELEGLFLNTYDQTDVIPAVEYLPVKGSLVLVKPEDEDHWYRGRVEAILETSKGARVSIYLVDYGRLVMARKKWIRDMPANCKKVSFQAIDFILPNLRPYSMMCDDQLVVSRRSSDDWDISAVQDIKTIVQEKKTATVLVEHFESDGLYCGQLVVAYQGHYINVNKFLLTNNFASDTLLESDGDKVSKITDDGMWIWSGNYDTSTLVGNVFIRPVSSSLGGRLSRRSNQGSQVSTENLSGRSHNRGPASSCSTPVALSGKSTPQKPSWPTGLGRDQAQRHLSEDLSISSTSSKDTQLKENEQRKKKESKIQSLDSSFGSSRPIGQSSPLKPGLGRGQVLLNLSTEWNRSRNNFRHLNRRNSVSSNEDSSSTISVSVFSTDSDKTDKVCRSGHSSRNVSQEIHPHIPQRSSESHSLKSVELTSKLQESSRVPSVNRTCLTTPKPSCSAPRNHMNMCESSIQSRSLEKNSAFKSADSSVVNGQIKSEASEKCQGSSSGRNGFISRFSNFNQSPRHDTKQAAQSVNKFKEKINPQCFQVGSSVDLGHHMSTVLRFGSFIPKPSKSLASASLTDILIQRLESLGFPGPSKIQSYAWPAILRGRSVAMISPDHSGKTLAGLLPILSFILQPEDYQPLEKCKGPLAVILCSNWEACQNVHSQCITLLPETYHTKVDCIFGGLGNQNKQFSLLGGCDLLITTPSCYLRIQETIQMNRCCHIMLDEADRLTECFTQQIKEIMVSFVNQYKSKPMRTSLPNQVLLCSSLCTSGIESFIQKLMPDPIVLISSYLEAAVYAKVPVYTKVTTKSKLTSTLTELVQSRGKPKTVVCTTSADVAAEVSRFLNCHSIYSLVAHEDMEHFNLKNVKLEWEEASCSAVLVVSDHILPEIEITSAEWLIHYDIPQFSCLEFGNRFVCLARNIQMKANLDQESEVRDSLCHVLLTPECELQSLKLIRFLKRLGTNPPVQLLELGCKKQFKVPLCPYLKSFGDCKFRHWCGFRHVVKNSLDCPTANLPHWGEVRIQLTHVVNASQFYGRLLEYRDPVTGAVMSNSNAYLNLQIQLTMHFGKKENIKKHGSASVGDICAIYISGGAYHRVKITRIHSTIECLSAQKASVFLLDEGRTEEVELKELISLPPKLVECPPQAIHILACGVEPVDGHQKWTLNADSFVHKNLFDKEIWGKVALCLQDTVFLELLVVRTKVLNSTYMMTFRHGPELVKQELATANSQHVPALRKLCEGEIVFHKPVNAPQGPSSSSSGNVNRCSSRASTSVEQKQTSSKVPSPSLKERESVVSASLAQKHQTLDTADVYKVYVNIVKNPHLFYAQLVKYYDALLALNNRINNLISNGKVKQAENLRPGVLCLGPLGDDSDCWYRALVTRETSSNMFELFFVDFGDYTESHSSNLFKIEPDLLELPFQAVECSLADVGPLNGSWTEKVTDEFVSMTRDDDDVFKELNLKVLDSAPSRSNNHQIHYSVKISEPDCKSIAAQLVDKALAVKCRKSTTVVNASDEEADCECSPMSVTPEPEEKNFTSAMLHAMLGENTRPFVETSDDESVSMAVRKSKPSRLSSIPSTSTDSSAVTTNVAACSDMPVLEVVAGATPSILPKVQWYQTKLELILMVQVHTYQEYEFYCTPKTIILNIHRGDQFFAFEEILYDEIVPTLSQTFPLGRIIKIKLSKCKGTRWPRLVQRTEKVSHLTYDADHLLTTSCDETASMRSYSSQHRGRGKRSSSVQMTTLPYDPCNMDDRASQETESDSDWSKEDAYNMFS